MLGSVNASVADFKKGIEELSGANQKYPEAIRKVITDKIPVDQFQKAFEVHDVNSIKTVIEWEAVG